MKAALTLLLLALGLTTTSALSQIKTSAKPTPKPATPNLKTTPAKPAATKPTGAAKPAAARPAGAAKPVAKPASRPTPAPAPAATTAPPATPPPAPAPPSPLGISAQQAPSFAKGMMAINLGVGLGRGYGYGLGFGGGVKSSPAISLSVEKGIVDGVGPGVISVGGLVGYKSYSYSWSFLGDSYKATWTNIYVAARGAYHYNFTANPKVDTYAGVSLAARIENYSNDYSNSTLGNSYGGTNVEVGIFLGGRYLFTNKIGAFAELGYDMSYLKLGLTTRF